MTTETPLTPMFYGKLNSGTRGCMDIHDHDTLCRHVCSGTIGVVGEMDQEAWDDHGEDSGPRDARWRIGDRVRMAQVSLPGGPYPECLLLSEYADVVRNNECRPDWEPSGPRSQFYQFPPIDTLPRASFQWKGTGIDLTFRCPVCLTECRAVGEYAYNVACVECHSAFVVDTYVSAERVG